MNKQPEKELTKLCPTCGQSQPVSKFYKDESRADGLQWRCKNCQLKYYTLPLHRNKNRRNAKKRRVKLATKRATQKQQRMRGDSEFKDLYNNLELKRFILKTVKTQKNAAGHPEYLEELIQDAWMEVATAPRGCDVATLKQVAQRAIWAAAKRFHRERKDNDNIMYVEDVDDSLKYTKPF